MNVKFQSDFRLLQTSAISAAAAIMAVGLAGCGGKNEEPPTPITMSAASMGNSPFIGVAVTATCNNKSVGVGQIGTMNAPGKGVLVFNGQCTAPVLIKATGAGTMRPIGAKADGSEDVAYDPAVNLPISVVLDVLPADGTFTANPVTSLIANLVKRGASIADARSKVENALGMNPGDAGNDYSDPDVARASSRIAAIAALAAEYVANNSTSLAGKTVGQFVEDAVAQAVMQAVISGSPSGLDSALGIANALKPTVDITTDRAVAERFIDSEANRVYNLLVRVQGLDGHPTDTTGVPVGLTDISNAISAISECVAQAHMAEVKKTAGKYQFAKKASDINAGTGTKESKRIDIGFANAIRISSEQALEPKILCGGSPPLVAVSTTGSNTTTTGSGTTTTGSGTTTTASGTTTTASGTTTTTAVSTTTTTTTTTVATQSTTTTATTTTTTAFVWRLQFPISFLAPEVKNVGLRWVGANIPASGGVSYNGASISFGPYTIGGLSSPVNVNMVGVFAAGRGYQTMSKNNGTATASEQSVSNGDTITLTINLAQYVADFGPLLYAKPYIPVISAPVTYYAFGNASPSNLDGIVTCADPAQPVSGYQTCQ